MLFRCFIIFSYIYQSRVTSVNKFYSDIPVFSSDVLLDTWEPSVVITSDNEVIIFGLNQYGVRGCLECGADPIIYRKTTDYGKTWNAIDGGSNTWGYINTYALTWFADIVAIKDKKDHLYITYIGYTAKPPPNPWNILFQKSTDKGETWSTPVIVSGDLSADKNWMSIDRNQPNIIYVTFNSQFPYSVTTFDKGETWSSPVLLDQLNGSYFYAGGSQVSSDGIVYHAYVATPDYGEEEVEGDDSYAYYEVYDDISNENATVANQTYARVYSSSDSGSTWTVHAISSWQDNQKCPEEAQCGSDFFTGSCNLAIDAIDDTVYYVYNGDDTSTPFVETRIMMSRLLPGELEFSIPFDVCDAPTDQNVYVGFTLLAVGNKKGDVRVAWMDNRTSVWNVYYRESTDHGDTWTTSIRLSFNNRFSFQTEDGFIFPYGDYGTMTVDSLGYTHVVWGEGLGWYAGGTVMYTTQAPDTSDIDNDSNSNSGEEGHSLSERDALILSNVISIFGGVILGGVLVYLFMIHRVSASNTIDDKKALNM